MCILHCMMVVGWSRGRFLEGLCNDLDKVLRAGVQSVLDAVQARIICVLG